MHLRAATSEMPRAVRATWSSPAADADAAQVADALLRLCALGAHRRLDACATAWGPQHPLALAAALCRAQAGPEGPLALLAAWDALPAAGWTPAHLSATVLVWTVGQAHSLPILPARLPRWSLNAAARVPVLAACAQLLAQHAPTVAATLPARGTSHVLPHAKDEPQGRLLRLLAVARATAPRNEMPAPAALLALAGSVAHGPALPFAVWRMDHAMVRDEAMTATAWLRSFRQHAATDDARAWADLQQGAQSAHPAGADEEAYRAALRRQDFAGAATAAARAALRIGDPALAYARALTAAWLGELAGLAADVRAGLWRAVQRAAQRSEQPLWQLWAAADLAVQNWEAAAEPRDVLAVCEGLTARPDGAAFAAAVQWLTGASSPHPPMATTLPLHEVVELASMFPSGDEATWWLTGGATTAGSSGARWCRLSPTGLPVVEPSVDADPALVREPEPLWAVARAWALRGRPGLPPAVDAQVDAGLEDGAWAQAVVALRTLADAHSEGEAAAWTLLTISACLAQDDQEAAAGDAVVDAVTAAPDDRVVRQVAVALLDDLGQHERVRALDTLVPLAPQPRSAPSIVVADDVDQPNVVAAGRPPRPASTTSGPDPLRTLLGAARARDTMAFLRLLDRGEQLATAEVAQADRRAVAWAALEAARVVQRRAGGDVQALALADAARTLDPRCGAAHAMVAAYHEAAQAWDEAAAALQSAARNEPDAQQRARWYLQLGQWFEGPLQHRQAALEHYLIAFMCEATLPGVLEHLEQLCRGLGRWKDLAGSLEIAAAHARQSPDRPWALTPLLLRLAEVQLKRLEQPARAATTLLEAVAYAPTESKALRLLLQHAAAAADPGAVRTAVQQHRQTLDDEARARFDAQPYVAGWL